MALINCPECNKEISDKAIACPHCGAPLKNNGIDRKHRLNNTSVKLKYIAVAFCVLVILPIIFYFGYKKFGNNALKEKQQSEISKSPAAPDTSSIKRDTIANKVDNTDTGKLFALVIKKEKPISINTANKDLEKQSSFKTAYCWYGWQEKKIGMDKSLNTTVYNVTNYASEIFAINYPSTLTEGEVTGIVDKHIADYCPIKEKASGENYNYVISIKFLVTSPTTYGGAEKSRKGKFSTFEEFNICSLSELQTKLNNAKHSSRNDIPKGGVNLYAIAFWYKITMKYDANGEPKGERTEIVTTPFKITCVSTNNMNNVNEIIEAHVKNNCNIPYGWIVGASTFGSYEGALDNMHQEFPNATNTSICSEDKLQDEICGQK